MIISDEFNFAFVHIPKCAGTFVRRKIKHYDTLRFHYGLGEHPQLGNIDYSHLPLFILKDFFPDEFSKLENCWSFAILRNPFDRFSSSLAQHINMFRTDSIHKMKKKEISRIINEIISFLQKNNKPNKILPAELIHFQRQIDYVKLDGKIIVDSLFSIEKMEILEKSFFEHTGENILFSDNKKTGVRNIVLRNTIIFYLFQAFHHFSKYLSDDSKKFLKKIIYIPRDQKFYEEFSSDSVQNFIEDYYYEDIELFNKISFK